MRDTTSARRGPKRARLGVWVLGGALAAVVGVAVTWYVVHRFEWAGPLVANSLRAVIGVDNVARLEDFVYAIEDRVNRLTRKGEAPRSHWQVPPKATPEAVSAAVTPSAPSTQQAPGLPPFQPKEPGPALKAWSAEGDGKWVPITDKRRPQEPVYMYKTLLHPDRGRSWAEVFVVAIDLRRVRLHVMAGTREPASDSKEAESYERKAVIPSEHHEELLAAFNGGFMTEHGGYGMKVDGVVLVKPRKDACTIAVYHDDSVRIASWEALAENEPNMRWYRQAPACMYEQGKLHPGLHDSRGRKWGATLDGNTVIRRSAIGLNSTRDVLFVAITNHTTARVLADAMLHAGAVDVAQLDVNWSYPKFVTFEPSASGNERIAVALAAGFEYSPDEYVRDRQRRDFFYLMRSDAGVPPPDGYVAPGAR